MYETCADVDQNGVLTLVPTIGGIDYPGDLRVLAPPYQDLICQPVCASIKEEIPPLQHASQWRWMQRPHLLLTDL